MKQLALALVSARRRRRRRAGSGVPHRRRPGFDRRLPVHVTMKVAAPVWNLRSRRSIRVLQVAMLGGASRFGARVVQGDHLHLLVEAQQLAVRVARGMNRLMGRRGRVIGDRYHARVLGSPTEVRRVVHYIRDNHRKHVEPKGARFSAGWVDPFAVALVLPAARTWLVRYALSNSAAPPWPPPTHIVTTP